MFSTLLAHPAIKLIRHHWLTVAFVGGFITDLILLNKIDDWFDNTVLAFYALLSTISFLLLYLGTAEKFPAKISKFVKDFAPIVMQYAFGGLLSGMLIFYGRSGDWLSSAPFLLLIIGVIFGNELIKKNSNRLVYHLLLYFIGIYAYIVLVVPVFIGRMGDLVFVISGMIALVVVTIVVQLLYRIVPNFMRQNTRNIIVTIGFVYITFNVLYFTALIPPIPLSLVALEVVHEVERRPATNDYRVVYEEQSWERRYLPLATIIHPSRQAVYCYARVYAPTRLQADIYHTWEYKDANGAWVVHDRIPYPIVHGNSVGYRGYTKIANYRSGVWRCTVETERGHVLGREVFEIITDGQVGRLVTRFE